MQVTVVDGDTNARVRGARVTIGDRSARSDRHGVARVPLPHRSALVTQAAKPGYAARSVRLSFRTHPKSTIRIYRRSLQWTMYGANPARSQAQPQLAVRPPFRVVWSRGLGTLIEFPAVVQDGVAYIANARGTVRALDMRNGDVIWRHDTPHGKMAASPAVWGDELVVHGMDGHVWVLRRSDGRLLWHYTVGSPVESSPVIVDGADVFGAWNGTITALDLRTHRVRWRYDDGCKVTSSAALAGSTLYLGDYCGRLVALHAAHRAGSLHARRRRPRLRHAGRLGGARLRAELDRRLADGVLDERPLPLAPLDRLVRLLVAGRRRRAASSSARTTASSTRSRRGPGGRSGRTAPAARSPAPLPSSTGSPTQARSRTASSGSTRAAAGSCSTSRTASTCRSRAPAAACCCTATRGSTRWCSGEAPADRGRRRRRPRAGRRRRRLLPARQAAGARHRRARRRSSSSRPRPRRRRRASPGSPGRRTATTPERQRFANGVSLAPPFRTEWTFRAQSLVEFPPAVGYGRLFFANNAGVVFAIGAKNGKRAWKYDSHRCVAASPALDRHVVYEAFLNAPPCNRQPSAALTGEVIAFAVGTGRVLWRHTIGPSESSPVVVGATVFVGDWDGRVWALRRRTGQAALGDDAALAGEERRRDLGQPPLRRRLLGPSLLAERDERQDRLAGEGAAALRQRRQLLRDAGARLRARLHRRDRRQGVLVRRVERQAALVAVDRRLRLLVRGGLALARSTSAPTPTRSSASTPRPATSCGGSTPTGRSPARRRSSPAASTSRRSRARRTRSTRGPARSPGRSPTASTRRSSPTRSASTSSATRGSTGSSSGARRRCGTLSATVGAARAAARPACATCASSGRARSRSGSARCRRTPRRRRARLPHRGARRQGRASAGRAECSSRRAGRFPRCATSSPGRPGSSAPTSPSRCSPRATRSSASTASPTTTTRR